MSHETLDGFTLYGQQRYKEAYDALYESAAFGRDAEAQYYLGMMYFYGDGVEKDAKKAEEWWKKAMRNGSIDAANRLSEISTSTKHAF